MSYFEKFKEELPNKEKCYSSLNDKKLVNEHCQRTKNMNMVLMFEKKIEMKTMKDYQM